MNKRSIGNDKEKIAAEYLRTLGYDISEMNFYYKTGEIDIVARDSGYLCFVEVKYRNSASRGVPEEAVDFRKIKRITKTAQAYMMLNRISEDTPCRFDVVSILGNELNVVKNAFDACY